MVGHVGASDDCESCTGTGFILQAVTGVQGVTLIRVRCPDCGGVGRSTKQALLMVPLLPRSEEETLIPRTRRSPHLLRIPEFLGHSPPCALAEGYRRHSCGAPPAGDLFSAWLRNQTTGVCAETHFLPYCLSSFLTNYGRYSSHRRFSVVGMPFGYRVDWAT